MEQILIEVYIKVYNAIIIMNSSRKNVIVSYILLIIYSY